jgi:hypothetical protein
MIFLPNKKPPESVAFHNMKVTVCQDSHGEFGAPGVL